MSEIEEKQKELFDTIVWGAFFNGVWCGAAGLMAVAIIIAGVQSKKNEDEADKKR